MGRGLGHVNTQDSELKKVPLFNPLFCAGSGKMTDATAKFHRFQRAMGSWPSGWCQRQQAAVAASRKYKAAPSSRRRGGGPRQRGGKLRDKMGRTKAFEELIDAMCVIWFVCVILCICSALVVFQDSHTCFSAMANVIIANAICATCSTNFIGTWMELSLRVVP